VGKAESQRHAYSSHPCPFLVPYFAPGESSYLDLSVSPLTIDVPSPKDRAALLVAPLDSLRSASASWALSNFRTRGGRQLHQGNMAAVQPQDGNSSEDGMRAQSTDAMASLIAKLNTEGVSANAFQSQSRSTLSTEEQKKVFESVIEHLKKSVDEDRVMAQNDDSEMEFDLEDQSAKTETLREVFQSVSQLWWSGSQQMDLVVENLADKSRDRESNYPISFFEPIPKTFRENSNSPWYKNLVSHCSFRDNST
jgi:hypothetical protein